MLSLYDGQMSALRFMFLNQHREVSRQVGIGYLNGKFDQQREMKIVRGVTKGVLNSWSDTQVNGKTHDLSAG